MNCFLIAAMSLDGFIAPLHDDLSTNWTSKEDKQFFINKTKEAGVVIMGSTTFETFGAKPLRDRRNIIYTKNKKYDGAETTNENPKYLLKRLEKEGFNQVAICGGSSIYSLFLEAGVINTLYITLEPFLFGSGIKLLNKEFNKKLTLVEIKKLGDNTLLLEYSVNN
jgi:dihydrofolate reductase